MDFDNENFEEFLEENKEELDAIAKELSRKLNPIKDIISKIMDRHRRFDIIKKKVELMLYYLDACGEKCTSVDMIDAYMILHFENGIKNKKLESTLAYHNLFLDDDNGEKYIQILPREDDNIELIADIIFSTEGTQ